jgi:hypothetical protein
MPSFVGHGFSRAVTRSKIMAALAAGTLKYELLHPVFSPAGRWARKDGALAPEIYFVVPSPARAHGFFSPAPIFLPDTPSGRPCTLAEKPARAGESHTLAPLAVERSTSDNAVANSLLRSL